MSSSAESASATPERRRFDRDDVVRLVAIAWSALVTFGWWAVLAVQWDDKPDMVRRDYYCFYRAGELWWNGGDPFSQQDHAFVNPPFTLPLVIGLALAGLRGSYVVLAALGSIGWVLGCVLASRLGEATDRRRDTLAFALVTAPCAFLALHLGQLSGIYFALLAGSLVLFARGRDGAAGALAGLLLAKPNFVVALVGAALVLRRPRFLVSLAAVGALLVLLSLPFGTEAWSDFFAALARLAHRHDVTVRDYWKQFTVYAFLRAVTYGADGSGTMARGISGAVLVAFGTAIVVILRRHRERWREPMMAARLASVIVLATCALNSYLFFYDAVFLALPAGCLWLAAPTWRRIALRRLAIACVALSWLLQVEVAWVHVNPPLAGLVSALWLAIELVDLWPVTAATAATNATAALPITEAPSTPTG
jgi:hypothetical protein